MRLIDADELKVNCVCLNSFCVDGRTIENAPTVKAIPIEWIKSKKTEITHEKYDYVRGCQEGFNDCIDMLIEDWEKENE